MTTQVHQFATASTRRRLMAMALLTFLAASCTFLSAAAASTRVSTHPSSVSELRGPWTTEHSRYASDGTFSQLSAPGYAQLQFTGTGVQWISKTNAYSGRADVYVDGTRRRTVDLYSAQTRFRQVVFSISGLRSGQHTLKIVRTGTKSAASGGRNLVVDAFRVLDDRAPGAPTGITAGLSRTGVGISWTANREADLAAYRVYRQSSPSGARTLVDTVRPPNRSLLDIGLAERSSYSYRVVAVDTSGNVSSVSQPVAVTTPAAAAPTPRRYTNCPTATVTVSTTTELATALATTRPGSVVRLNPGRYVGQFTLSAHGTATAPIWVCGPRTAVLDGGGPSKRGGFRVQSSSHVVLTGMTVRNSTKGIKVWDSLAVTVSDTRVEDIGDEGIHLLDRTTDSTVTHNSISRTGLVNPRYGEGIYVGTAQENWCRYSDCAPDRSDRNTITFNDISRTPAEGIEAKVATSGGLVSHNTVNGTGMLSSTFALIHVQGNGYLVSHNLGSNSSIDGVLVLQRLAGWGRNNAVFGNHFSGRIPGYGVRLDPADLGNVVACGTTAPHTALAATNKACQR